MMIQKNNLFVIVLVLFLCTYINASETNEVKIEIKAYSSEIKIGEPLILKISRIYSSPNLDSDTGEIRISVGIPAPYLFVTIEGQKEEFKHESIFTILNKSLLLFDKEKKGLEYTGHYIALYDRSKKGLLFDEPGKYSCCFGNPKYKLLSNSIDIDVKPSSEQEKQALSILTGEFDLGILESPDSDVDLTEFPGALDRFKQVVEQCPDTMLAKMAAACVGMELYREYEKQRTEAKLEKIDISKQIWKESAEYLQKGLELPSAFAVREDILFTLAESEIEVGEKDYLKAISYLEELADKYPKGRFGKSALSGIEEVQTMMANDPNWANRVKEEQVPGKPIGMVALPIAGAAVAVIVITGLLFMFLGKKKPNKAE